MAIKDENVRAQITIPKLLKAKLEELAKKDNRTWGNYAVTILQKHVEELEKKQS